VAVTDESTDYEAAYRSLRTRVTELVRHATEDQLDAIAPATPEWRTRDVLAHLTGETTDILTGNLDGVGTDPWTQVQVDDRRDWSVDQLIAEWEGNAAQLEPMIPSFGPLAGQFTVDAATHEHDVRGALDAPGARESDALTIAYLWLGSRVGEIREGEGAGALRVDTESGIHVFGTGEPTASCATTRFEFFRAATGRRSLDQIESWGWDGDDRRPALIVMPIFTPRPQPFVE
jgi:uncharacterized protein (TIGR03083 family)